ncbi:hypothetical protein [Dyadobacter psychrophilus]|uniref:Uncharacterized protein n=1 Tax=Dyadobacter psychrophilus TaxID=651661 RepID=A0A1T5EQH4_9BACT|nr:hypothetical protein [Dyadobacter psychrophilus]SKB86197.1 hypothetical protein SAMN05660293_02687 [Dyadobacter psychrophilus]
MFNKNYANGELLMRDIWHVFSQDKYDLLMDVSYPNPHQIRQSIDQNRPLFKTNNNRRL